MEQASLPTYMQFILQALVILVPVLVVYVRQNKRITVATKTQDKRIAAIEQENKDLKNEQKKMETRYTKLETDYAELRREYDKMLKEQAGYRDGF